MVVEILKKAIPGVWFKTGVTEWQFGTIHIWDIEASDGADILEKLFDKCWAAANREVVTRARKRGRKIINLFAEDMFIENVEKKVPSWIKGWRGIDWFGKLLNGGHGSIGRICFG